MILVTYSKAVHHCGSGSSLIYKNYAGQQFIKSLIFVNLGFDDEVTNKQSSHCLKFWILFSVNQRCKWFSFQLMVYAKRSVVVQKLFEIQGFYGFSLISVELCLASFNTLWVAFDESKLFYQEEIFLFLDANRRPGKICL